jgi:iron complex outermembrane recepter protein
MRSTLIVLVLLLAFDANAQDSLRRVSGSTVTVSGVASPVDSLPISTSYRRIEPTQTLTSNSLEQAVRAVPGVQIDNRNNYALGDRITMRGIGARSFFGTRGIRVIKDDIPLTFADGQTNLEIIDPSQLASVQVLHGPASSIFGNASGGTLIFKSSLPPSPGELVKVGATFGSLGQRRIIASIGRTGESAAYGFYFAHDTLQGYRDWSGMRALHLGGQALLSFHEDALRLSFDNVSFSAQNPGALSQKLLDSNRRTAYAPNVRQKTGKDGHQSQVGLTYLMNGPFEWTNSLFGVFRNVTNPTPQQIVDLDRSMFGFRTSLETSVNKDLSDTSAISRFFDQHNTRIGLFADLKYQLDSRLESSNDSGRRLARQTDQQETILNLGVGLNAGATMFGGVYLFSSLRYDAIHFEATDNLVTPDNPDNSGSVTMSYLSATGGAVLEWTKNHRISISAAQGLETPTSTELANRPDGSGGYNNELQPQVVTTLDLVLRGRISELFDYNVTGFNTMIYDALIPFQVAGQEGRDFYRNAGTINNRGVEVELATEPLESFRAALGYTYIFSTFEDYTVGAVSYARNRQPGVHPHLGSLDLTYIPLEGLSLNAAVRYAAKVAVNDANTFYSSEYTVADFKASYEYIFGLSTRSLRVLPFVHVMNVFDRKYIGSFAINAFGGRYYEPSPERTIYAGIQVAY